MDFDEKRRKELKKIIAPVAREEVALIEEYMRMLEKIDDEDAWQLFRKMIVESAKHLTLDTEMLVKLVPNPAKGNKASKQELRELLKELEKAEACEAKAFKMYDEALKELDDPYSKGTVKWIRDEEAKHVKMVQELKKITEEKLSKM